MRLSYERMKVTLSTFKLCSCLIIKVCRVSSRMVSVFFTGWRTTSREIRVFYQQSGIMTVLQCDSIIRKRRILSICRSLKTKTIVIRVCWQDMETQTVPLTVQTQQVKNPLPATKKPTLRTWHTSCYINSYISSKLLSTLISFNLLFFFAPENTKQNMKLDMTPAGRVTQRALQTELVTSRPTSSWRRNVPSTNTAYVSKLPAFGFDGTSLWIHVTWHSAAVYPEREV